MPGTVLVAGGDARLAERLQQSLSLEGFRVETVEDGHAAVAHAARVAPDLIVLDAAAPGMPAPTSFSACGPPGASL